jgi:PAS domain S-box-containing protein
LPTDDAPDAETTRTSEDPGEKLHAAGEEHSRALQEELDAARAHFADFYDLAPVGYVTLTEAGLICRANLTTANLLGIPRADLPDRPLTEYLPPEDQGLYCELRRQLIATRGAQSCELRLLRADGTTVWAKLTAILGREEDGSPILRCVLADISERKRTEDALRESADRFRALVEWSPEPIVVHRDGVVLYANPAILRLFGAASAEHIVGKSLLDRVHPESRAAVLARMRAVSEGASAAPLIEERHVKFDGTVLDVEVQTASFPYDGAPAIYVTVRDITERKRAEQQLTYIMAAVESASDAIGITDAQGHHVYQNKALTDLFGYATAAELEAAGGGPVVVKDPLIAKQMFDHITKGMSWAGELEMVTRSGRVFPAFERANAIRNDAGEVVGVMGVISDITERKRNEEELRASEYRWKFAVEGAGDGLWDWDLPKGTVAFSRRWKEMLGFEDDEIGTGLEEWSKRVHPDDFAQTMDAVQAHLEGRTPMYSSEHRVACKNGEWKWVLDRGLTVSRDDTGKPLRVIGTHSDITARKRAERELRESEEVLSALVHHSPIYVYLKEVTATESRVLRVSDNFAKMSGILSADMDGRTMDELFPPDVAAKMTADDWRVVSEGKVLNVEEELAGRCYSSVKFPVNVGERRLLAGYTTDVTERRTAEAKNAALEAQNRALQKSESLGRMAGAIAHHFNNQLHTVMMSLEEAMDGRDAGPSELLREAWQAAQKAAEMSTQMLAYVGHSRGQRELLDVSEVCRQQLPALLSCVPHGVGLETDLPAPGPPVRCGAGELQRVLANLVRNAGEARAEPGSVVRVRVTTIAAGEIPQAQRFPADWQPRAATYACLEVADSGGGIAASDLENLCDPFFSTKFVGRGLGLPVALGIVRAHEGALTVETALGRGSVFRAYLPTAAEALPQKSVPEPRATREAAGGTVLLVDDEPGVRRAVARALERAGLTVLTAADGVEAVELFQAHRAEIGCVLSDVSMPRLDGWQTLSAVRALAPGFPVILASGYSEAQVMEGEHPELPAAFLSKPYQTDVLLRTLREILSSGSK